MIIKKTILFASNGIMMCEDDTDFSEVFEYLKPNSGDRTIPAKTAIGEAIFDLALDCLGEEVPDDCYLQGFKMEVKLQPVSHKKLS